MARDPHAPATGAARRFTLVEVMVAMVVLSLMMMMLFQFIVSAQRIWTLSDSTSRIYANSRTVFDVLERDFKAAVASNVEGATIGFFTGDPTPENAYDCLHTCFVVCAEPDHTDSTARLVEVSYAHHIDPDVPDTAYILRRQSVSNHDTANWDFLNQPAGWHLNDSPSANLPDYEEVVRGVAEFEMLFYDQSGARIAPDSQVTALPAKVVVNLSLFDDQLMDAPDSRRFSTLRAYTKVFPLGHLVRSD